MNQVLTPGLLSVPNFFQRRTKAELVVTPPKKNAEVADALLQINQLATDYRSFKDSVLDRTDRALWGLLGNVYDYVVRINKSVQKRQIKNELINEIKMRGGASVAPSAETELIVVRYVFAELPRQTRNNYVVVFEKALALGIESGKLSEFLEVNNGVARVVEKTFDGLTSTSSQEKDLLKAQRAEAITLIRRLLDVMSRTDGAMRISTSQVVDWTPSARELSTLKGADKSAPKYQPGDFVVFLASPEDTQGQYTLIQGFSATRDFEDQLLLQIATRLGASNAELQATLDEFEAALTNG